MNKKKYPKTTVIGFMPMVKDGNEIWGFEISELSEEEKADLAKEKHLTDKKQEVL